MRTTVYFITNRAPGAAGAPPGEAFGAQMVALEGRRLACGTAFVTNTDPDPATLEQRAVEEIGAIEVDLFSQAVQDDIFGAGKPLLVFVHGFANSFSDALCRAAFNREWFAASGIPEADCTVIAFTWPSAGRVIDGASIIPGVATLLFTLLGFALSRELHTPLAGRYAADKDNARGSGRDLARSLDRLAPLFERVRAAGRGVHLLVHSMGHVALRGAFAAWEGSGQAPGFVFDEAVLAAADEDAAFAGHAPDWLLAMPRLARRTSLYHSREDQILMVSEAVNNDVRRLGLTSPPDRAGFSGPGFRCVDCAGVQDAVKKSEIDYTHQYYRRVTAVRDDIARTLAGGGAPGEVVL